jgi:hydrogenase maturation protease
MADPPRPTLVIGCGNMLGADDGVGLAALERLRDRYALPPEVRLEDGGTWGLNLLPLIEDSSRLLLVDAINTGATAGTLTVLERDRLPMYFSQKVSPHQIDLREVLALAEFRGTLPVDTVAVGLQPERIEMSTVLSPSVADRVDELVNAVVARLRSWGHEVRLAAQATHA